MVPLRRPPFGMMRLFYLDVRCAEETHHHVTGLGWRRGDLAAEFQPLAGSEDAARRRHGPGVDFLAAGVTGGETQARHLDRLASFAHDRALHDQGIVAVLDFLCNSDVLEFK